MEANSRWYRGWIGVGGECHVIVSTGTTLEALRADGNEFKDRADRLDSFDWGKPSRAAYMLARTLLVDALGRARADERNSAEFMEQVLMRFPMGPDWQLTAGDIHRWAAAVRSGAPQPQS
jgi:hypothetical protein